MAVLMQSAVTLLLLLLPSLLVCSATLAAAEAGDETALLAFKAAAVPGGNSDALASWNRSAGGRFCSWEGVRCGSRHRRVVALPRTRRRPLPCRWKPIVPPDSGPECQRVQRGHPSEPWPLAPPPGPQPKQQRLL
jgi:hypothetical protein